MTMTTANAIVILREKLGLTQQQLAEKLGVSPFSVNRYEGGREPSREIVRKLARLAQIAKLDSVSGFFQHTREIDIEASYKNRASSGTGRHVPLGDLKAWSAFLSQIKKDLDDAIGSFSSNRPRSSDAIENARWTADHLQDDIRLYVGPDLYSSMQGLQEEKAIMEEEEELRRLHSAAWTKGE
jgi:transcriptional regulator with XRE-family HTH domain